MKCFIILLFFLCFLVSQLVKQQGEIISLLANFMGQKQQQQPTVTLSSPLNPPTVNLNPHPSNYTPLPPQNIDHTLPSHKELTPQSNQLSAPADFSSRNHVNPHPPPPQNLDCNLPSLKQLTPSQSSQQPSAPPSFPSHSHFNPQPSGPPPPQVDFDSTQPPQTTPSIASPNIHPLNHQFQELTTPSSKQAPPKASQPCFESTEVLELLSSLNPDSLSDSVTGEDSDYVTWGDSSCDVFEFAPPKPQISTAKPKHFGSRSERNLSTSSSVYSDFRAQSSSRELSSGHSVSSDFSVLSSSREPSSSRSMSASSPQPQQVSSIPPPPFQTPPKLQSVEQVMSNYTGTDVASLRVLTTALAREAIFGREEMSKASLSGRKGTGQLHQEKLNYIKTLVKSRVPDKPAVEFEHIWTLCRASLSKSCQALRHGAKRKL